MSPLLRTRKVVVMAYSHFFFIEDYQVPYLTTLIQNKKNGQYVVLARSNGFCDIAQYSDKFENIKIITVREEALNPNDKL